MNVSISQYQPQQYRTVYTVADSLANQVTISYNSTCDNYALLNKSGSSYATSSTINLYASKYSINDRVSYIYPTNIIIIRSLPNLGLNLTYTVDGITSYSMVGGNNESYTYTENAPVNITTTQGLLSTYNIFLNSTGIYLRSVSRSDTRNTITYSYVDGNSQHTFNRIYLYGGVTTLLNQVSTTYTFTNSITSTATSFIDYDLSININNDRLTVSSVGSGNYQVTYFSLDSISNEKLITSKDISIPSLRTDSLTKTTSQIDLDDFIPLRNVNYSKTYVDTNNSLFITEYGSRLGTSCTISQSNSSSYNNITLNTTSYTLSTEVLYSSSYATSWNSFYWSAEASVTPYISTDIHYTYDEYSSVSTTIYISSKTNLVRGQSYISNFIPTYGVSASITSYNANVLTASNVSKSTSSHYSVRFTTSYVHPYETGTVVSSSITSEVYSYSTYTETYSTQSVTYNWSWDDLSYSTSDSTIISGLYSREEFTETLSTVDSYNITSESFKDSAISYIGYSTEYYGSLFGPNINETSWKYVANQSTQIVHSTYIDSYFTIENRGSTFGISNINSTTMSQSKFISSSVRADIFSTKESYNTKSYISSSTESAINIPVESYYTYYTSYTEGTITTFGTDYSYYNITINYTATSTVNRESYDYTSSVSTNYDDYGTTYRLSTMISSETSGGVVNTSAVVFYDYSYSVQSIWSYNAALMSTLSEYTTALKTSFTVEPFYIYEVMTYDITASASNATKTSDERFNYRVEIYRTSTSNMSVYNTIIADNNGNPLATIYSSTNTRYINSTQSVITTSQTFISSTADLSVMNISTSNSYTTSVVRGNFKSSVASLLSSTFEQQNETLIFASTFNTSSFYNNTTTYSTVNTIVETVSATTYNEWYNPSSWTESKTEQITSSTNENVVSVSSGSVSVTQTVGYTPTYSDVDGIYVTA